MELSADSGWSGSAASEALSEDTQKHRSNHGAPRKLANIFAAFSASPGNVKPCAKLWDSVASLLEPSFRKALACMLAF